MAKAKFIYLILLLSSLMIQAENVSITGIVKKTGMTTGIADVKVTLAKKSSLSATTDTEGRFVLSDPTAIQRFQPEIYSFHINLKGNCIVFSPLSRDVVGSMEIFSGNGKKIFSADLFLDKNGTRSVTLPQLGSGINLMRITIRGRSVCRTLVTIGNDMYLKDGFVSAGCIGRFSIEKQASAAVVDTLIVSKTGYITQKVNLDSYTKENVTIELDTAGTENECTRESLKAIVDKYIEAQTAGDPTMMPLAEDVKVKVNGQDTSMQESVLTEALKIDFDLSIYDVDSCRTFTEVIVANSSPAYVMGTRLRIEDEKITEINMIVTKEGDWLFNAEDYLKYAKQQDWYILPENERSTREKLIDAGDQYLDIFNDDFEDLPWGAPCYRIEGGAVTFRGDTTADYCKVSKSDLMSGDPFLIGERDYIVDVDLGTSNVYCAFCKLDSHMFRLVNGHYRYVHTLTVGCN